MRIGQTSAQFFTPPFPALSKCLQQLTQTDTPIGPAIALLDASSPLGHLPRTRLFEFEILLWRTSHVAPPLCLLTQTDTPIGPAIALLDASSPLGHLPRTRLFEFEILLWRTSHVAPPLCLVTGRSPVQIGRAHV